MSALHQHDPPRHREPSSEAPEHGRGGGHSRWMMIACCVPMLAIAVVVALSGAGLRFLFVAIMCTLMMAMMMGGMHGDSGSDESDRKR